MGNADNRILTGVKEISNHTKRSWNTIDTWIKRKHFPAKKLDGVWMASSQRIDIWIQEQIELSEKTTQ